MDNVYDAVEAIYIFIPIIAIIVLVATIYLNTGGGGETNEIDEGKSWRRLYRRKTDPPRSKISQFLSSSNSDILHRCHAHCSFLFSYYFEFCR
ncbi:hypothetical protein PRIPAC_86182 [Pristionchus pacificus]|nr:hypothetical protein PRIPAC_86182 [Pristionchus pacificus]